jgi:Uma2 family endonuclease
MIQAVLNQPLSFEDYIDFCSQTDKRYELVRGELIRMTPPTWLHIKIAKFLERVFDAAIAALGYNWEAFRDSGQKTEGNTSRLPDVIVAPIEAIEPLLNQTAILQVAAPIVVEIVSPSSASVDYTDKLKEYLELGIPEYWVVDPEALGAAKHIGFPKVPTISIYILDNGTYQVSQFRGSQQIVSPTFPGLQLTAEQVFRGKFS